MMKIVINALQYKKNSSGIGVLIANLFGKFVSATSLPCEVVVTRDCPGVPGAERAGLIEAPCVYAQGVRRIIFQSVVLGRKHCHHALLLTTDSKSPFFLPKTCRLVPVVTDLAVFRMPQVYRFSRVLLWRAQFHYLLRHAAHYIAISEFTKAEMVRLLKLNPEKIDVVPCACSPALSRVHDPDRLVALREKYHLPERMVLFVGSNNPRKNLNRIIRAFDRIRENIQEELVIVGDQGWKFDKESVLRDVRHRGSVHFVGFIPDDELAGFYSLASLLVFTTLYEGFGVPVLEAQQCGTPVLTSTTSSLPEVAGQGAFLVDPYREEDIALGIKRVLSDAPLRERLIRDGYENTKKYSWDASAKRLKEVICRIISHEC